MRLLGLRVHLIEAHTDPCIPLVYIGSLELLVLLYYYTSLPAYLGNGLSKGRETKTGCGLYTCTALTTSVRGVKGPLSTTL